MANSFKVSDTTYTTTEVKIGTTRFAVTVVSGKYNYVNVRKLTNNPFGGPGKDFENFDAAAHHYKSPAMKTALLKIELNIN